MVAQPSHPCPLSCHCPPTRRRSPENYLGSVTPSHVGEQKADPQLTVPREGNKTKLCTPGQRRKKSRQGLTQPPVGTPSAQKPRGWSSASQYLAPAGFMLVSPPQLPALPRALPTQHGPGSTHTCNRTPERDKQQTRDGPLDTSLFFPFEGLEQVRPS